MSSKAEMPGFDELNTLYRVNGFSASQIAALYAVSAMTVFSWFKKLGIEPRPSKKNVYQEIRCTPLTALQRELIVGSLLGDGSLRVPKHGKNAMYTEKHSVVQQDYLAWKMGLLLPFVQTKLVAEPPQIRIISGVRTETEASVKLVSVSHPELTELWRLFYNGNGNKVVPPSIHGFFTEFSLAVWFMDDGSLVWRPRYYRFDVDTETFSYDEQLLLKSLIGRFFRGRILIIPRRYEHGTRFYLSLRGKQELSELLTRLQGIYKGCMDYKFDIS